MFVRKTPKSPARVLAAVTLLAASMFVGALAASSSAAPETTAITPTTMSGSYDPATAALIQYNATGSFYGIRNATSGAIEPIRGYLQASSTLHNQYYKIDLPRGKVLDVKLGTRGYSYVPFGNGQRISPDFELFTYAGVPGPSTMIDWNVAPFTNYVWQENNILTPIAPSATYYINVSAWFGQGEYDLIITVTDPLVVSPGDYTGNLDAESQNPGNRDLSRDADTQWFRFTATHNTAAQIFQEASGWLNITNFNNANPYQIDALIRIFAEDTGYSPENPIGKPIEKSEAPNRMVEPFNILAPYTGTYYIMIRIANETSANYLIHFDLQNIPRFPSGGLFGVHKERTFDDTDWFWFNMSKGGGATPPDRVIFNMSEQSDDPLKPVNLNLWLFGYRDYFTPNGATTDFDILNSSFEGDAPYNLTQNPEPRYEEVAATASYTGIYFIEVEDYNNTGNYTLTQSFDTSPNRPQSDFNNEPSQAAATDWGRYDGLNFSQSDDHTDFYKVSAQAGETIEVTFEMPRRSSPDNTVTNSTLGLVWVGIYQPGMQLLAWEWNYWFDYDQNGNPVDHLNQSVTVRATVAADGDYIVEVTAMQDGFIGTFQRPGTPPPPPLQVFWHMDWNFQTTYKLWISRLPGLNAQWELPTITAALPDLTLSEGATSQGVYNLSNFFYDPDWLQGDTLDFNFSFSGMQNISISDDNGLVTISPRVEPGAQPPIDETDWHGTNTVHVRATDDQNQYVSQTWNITYVAVNDAPFVVSANPIRFSEDSGVVILPLYNVIKDVDGDTLQFSQVADSNITLAFTSTTMRVTTAPDFQTTTLGAPYSVFVDVNDGTAVVRLELRFTVDNILDAPRVLAGNRNISCDEDVACPLFDLNRVFVDPDDPLRTKPLNFQVSGNGEIGFDLFNGSLLLKPPADWSGAKTIQVQAIKFSTGSVPVPYPSDVVELNLVVREINDPPRVLSYSPPVGEVSVTEGGTKTFSVDAEDPEHLQPTFRWYLDDVSVDNTLPGYTFVALFTMSHPGQNSTMVLKVVIADGAGGEATHEWAVTVIDFPRAPQVTIASPLEGNRGYFVGQPVHFFASAFDPDGDVLSFKWTLASTGETILETAEGDYSFTTTGTLRVQLEVMDRPNGNVVRLTVNVTVSPPPPAQPGFDTPLTLGALGAVAAFAIVAHRRRRVE